MMNNSELRIGNLITYESDIVEVSGISRSGCIDYNKNGYDYGGWTSNEYQPIPLTEEWLVKFGLKETKDQDVLRVNYVNYHKGTDTFNYCIAYYFDDQGYVDNIFKEVKYVHQLQNLYFALTNEELNYEQ